MYRCNKGFFVFFIFCFLFLLFLKFSNVFYLKKPLKKIYQVVGKAILKPQEKISYAIDVVIYLV